VDIIWLFVSHEYYHIKGSICGIGSVAYTSVGDWPSRKFCLPYEPLRSTADGSVAGSTRSQDVTGAVSAAEANSWSWQVSLL